MIWRRATEPEPVLRPAPGCRILFTPRVEPVGNLPYELAGLLPNRNHNQDLMTLIDELPENRSGDRAVVGVFAADPFLNCKQLASHLADKGYHRAANIPPVAGYGAEFLTTLDIVESGRIREQQNLERLVEHGLTVCPAVASRECLPYALAWSPDLIWVSPGFDMYRDGLVQPDALLNLCREVSKSTDTPVILITGNTGVTNKQALEAGAGGVLLDPPA